MSYKAIVTVACALLTSACATTSSPKADTAPAKESEAPERTLSADQIEEIHDTIRRRLPSLSSRCFQRELESRDESFSIKTTMRVLIGKKGVAERAVLSAAKNVTPDFERCVAESVSAWEFPALANPTWFSFPLSFSPAY